MTPDLSAFSSFPTSKLSPYFDVIWCVSGVLIRAVRVAMTLYFDQSAAQAEAEAEAVDVAVR